VESARHRWPPVVAVHVGWPLLSTTPDVIQGSHRPFHFSPPSFGRTPRCFALKQSLLRPSPTSHPELSDRAKRSASSLCPSCTKSLSVGPASGAGPRDFPAVVFLHERLTGDSLLRSFPHSTDPAASYAPPRTPPRPLLRPPQPLLQPLTDVSSPSARTPPQNRPLLMSTPS
jgi:hypothetical protein